MAKIQFLNFCRVTLTFDLGNLIFGMQGYIAHMYHTCISHTNFEFINYSTNVPLFLTENSKLTFWPLWPWPLAPNQKSGDIIWGTLHRMFIPSLVQIHHHLREIWAKFIFSNFCRVTLTFDLGDLMFCMQGHIAHMSYMSHTKFKSIHKWRNVPPFLVEYWKFTFWPLWPWPLTPNQNPGDIIWGT